MRTEEQIGEAFAHWILAYMPLIEKLQAEETAVKRGRETRKKNVALEASERALLGKFASLIARRLLEDLDVKEQPPVVPPEQETRRPEPTKILRRAELIQRLGISNSTLWRWTQNDPTFPPAIRLGSHLVGWREIDVDSWLRTREQRSHTRIRERPTP